MQLRAIVCIHVNSHSKCFHSVNIHPLSCASLATGSAGMETCLVNLLEPGEKIVVGVHGVFGGRMCEVASRAGAQVRANAPRLFVPFLNECCSIHHQVVRVEAPYGQCLSLETMKEAIETHRPAVVAFVHAEVCLYNCSLCLSFYLSLSLSLYIYI